MAERKMTTRKKTKNTDTGKWQKIHTWKMAEQKMTTRKKTKNTDTGKWQKIHTWKMTERKMHDMENGRTENAHPGI